MFKELVFALLILSSCSITVSSSSVADNDNEYSRCSCDEEGFWSVGNILECQRVSDFLIAVAYFSIPVELLYFVSCSNIPFKWVLFQFIAFIVLCGMTHLLNSWTFRPHTFRLMLALTIFKLLTALVSFATAITLITLIPLLLKVKVREFMLIKKTWDLDREVGIIKKQKEAGLHVRMLTHEIRKSLDRHTILYTTLVELSKTLDLQNCAIWMPNAGRTEMHLTHELKGRNFSNNVEPVSTSDRDVRRIKGSDGVKIIDPKSALAVGSSGGTCELGSVAAIRMPMLKVANFKEGTSHDLVPSYYAILVLVLPDEQDRTWTSQELEIVEVVADQVAVALSHASVLEESQLMREKLEEQNRALQHAKQDALMASQARNGFQTVMSNGLRCPMHSILGLLSFLQEDSLSDEQRLIIDSMVKSSGVLSTLISDILDTSAKDNGRFPLDLRSFSLHSMIREATCVSKCLCTSMGFEFLVDVDKSLPDHVVGDERRLFQVILHMVGSTLNGNSGGCLVLRIYSTSGSQGWNNDRRWTQLKSNNSNDGHIFIKFEVGMTNHQVDYSLPFIPQRFDGAIEESLSFKACRKLVQLMHGDIRVTSNPDRCMGLLLRFQVHQPSSTGITEQHEDNTHHHSNSICRGLNVLLVDSDDINRAVTQRLLDKLGCYVSSISSGNKCLSAITSTSYEIVLLDLHLADVDAFEVTARIRKFRSRNYWPLIIGVTSSDDDDDLRDKCVRIGMNGVIQKPCSLQEIAYEIKRVLLQVNNRGLS